MKKTLFALFVSAALFSQVQAKENHPKTPSLQQLRTQAEQGNAEAQYNLAVMLSTGQGARKDDEEARRWYSASAEQGYALAENNLGVIYENGVGVPADSGKALACYLRAAQDGDDVGQQNFQRLGDKNRNYANAMLDRVAQRNRNAGNFMLARKTDPAELNKPAFFCK